MGRDTVVSCSTNKDISQQVIMEVVFVFFFPLRYLIRNCSEKNLV